MCIHSRQEILDSIKNSAHRLGHSAYGVLWLESPDGSEIRGMDCLDVRNTSRLMDVLTNIRDYWHIEAKGWTVHLEHINLQRLMYGLPAISLDDLPAPKNPEREAVAA